MPKKEPKFTNKVRQQIARFREQFKHNIDQYHEFAEFVMGGQWKDEEAKLFEDYAKIPLTFNKCGTIMNHLLGEQRQNTPSLQVVPDESVQVETAHVREALVKDITLSSDAKQVFQNAFQQAAVGGYGMIGIRCKYNDDYDFQQEPEFFSIKDPTRSYWDIAAEAQTKTDGMYAGYMQRMSRDKFRKLYGKKIERDIPTSSEDDTMLAFTDDNTITLINHYERKYKTIKIYHLSNDEVVDEKTLKLLPKITYEDKEMLLYQDEPVAIIQSREVPRYKIKYYLIAGDYILDESEFPSEQLPIIFLDQNSFYDKKGMQVCRPFLKDIKDAQRYINYLGTQSAHILKVSRYDQFMVSKENVRGADTQAAWRDPCTYLGGLFYDESPSGARPERLTPPELPQSFMIQYQRAMSDLQTGTGIYDTQMGENGNEISGAAIDARTRRGSYNTYVIFDSLNRAITCAGQIINEMIPILYDTERHLMLNLPDKGMQPVTLNQPVDEYSSEIMNDMTAGRYKIRLLPGPSSEGQKEQNLNSLQAVLTADPSLFRMVADLYAENLPMPNNIEIRNRLKTIVPPEIIEAGKTGQPIQQQQNQPSPEEQAAMMMQQAKMKEIELKQQDILRKQEEMKMKDAHMQEQLKIEYERLDKEKVEAAAKLQEQILRYQAEMHRTNSDAESKNAANIVKILTHSPRF
jgi:Phage P22-like portal protein